MYKKSKHSGLTIMEIMIAIGIFGVIMAGAASLFRGFEKENADLNKRIHSSTLETNVAIAMKNPALVRELLIDTKENHELQRCFEFGCPAGTTGDVKFSELVDWALRGVDFQASFATYGNDLVEIKVTLTSTIQSAFQRKFSIYLARRDYLILPKNLSPLKCDKNYFLNGVQFNPWNPICKHI